MTFREVKEFFKKHKFRIYFILLLSFLILDPLPTPQVIDSLFAWGLIVIFFFSPFFMRGNWRSFGICLAFFLMLVIGSALDYMQIFLYVRLALSVATMMFYFGTVVYLLWYTLREAVISDDLIFSGLVGFFMIGIGFVFIFGVFQDFGLMGYNTPEGRVEVLKEGNLIYFSLSNLSALGIGDITPATNVAKRLTVLESCVGTLYVAVFIGRLIGLSSGILNPRNRFPKDKIKKI